jgi:hypothetical protein
MLSLYLPKRIKGFNHELLQHQQTVLHKCHLGLETRGLCQVLDTSSYHTSYLYQVILKSLNA